MAKLLASDAYKAMRGTSMALKIGMSRQHVGAISPSHQLYIACAHLEPENVLPANSSPHQTMKKRRSKSLEKIARTVKDADEFVEHIFGIAAAYRAQHELESSAKGAEIRKAIKSFEKYAAALQLWLQQALKNSPTAEHEALNQLSTALHGSPLSARAQAQTTQLWLASLAGVNERALQALKRSPVHRAPLAAAEALRETFKHHGLKVSYRSSAENPSDAIRLFCAIAKDAGDVSMTTELARECLKTKVSD